MPKGFNGSILVLMVLLALFASVHVSSCAQSSQDSEDNQSQNEDTGTGDSGDPTVDNGNHESQDDDRPENEEEDTEAQQEVEYLDPVAIAEPGRIDVLVGETIWFDGSASYDPDNEEEEENSGITKWEWDFGYEDEFNPDTDVGDGPIAHWTFDNPDEQYQIQLKVTDDDDEPGTALLNRPLIVRVYEQGRVEAAGEIARAIASQNRARIGSEIEFSDNGSQAPSPITLFKWDWENDDVFEGQGQTVIHAFDKAGTHLVQFQVYWNEPIGLGEGETADEDTEQQEQQEAGEQPDAQEEDVEAQETESSQDENEGTTETEESQQTRTETDSLYAPLEIEIMKPVIVAVATADHHTIQADEETTVQFDGSGSYYIDSEGNQQDVSGWGWDWENDGDVDADGETASYKFPKAGIYYVMLRVKDDSDNEARLWHPLAIEVAGRGGSLTWLIPLAIFLVCAVIVGGVYYYIHSLPSEQDGRKTKPSNHRDRQRLDTRSGSSQYDRPERQLPVAPQLPPGQIAVSRTEYSELQKIRATFNTEISRIARDLDQKKSEIDALRSRFDVLQSNINGLIRKQEKAVDELKDWRETLKSDVTSNIDTGLTVLNSEFQQVFCTQVKQVMEEMSMEVNIQLSNLESHLRHEINSRLSDGESDKLSGRSDELVDKKNTEP